MIVKKTGGRIIGAELNAAERKAMDMEITRQIKAFDERNQINVEACLPWALHELCGFGPGRLRKFWEGFQTYYDGLLDHYELEDGGEASGYLALRALEALGVDVAAWHRETT